MASHHVSNSFLAPGLSHAYGHVMPLQCCVDVDVEGNTQTLNLIQEAGHLQNNQFQSRMSNAAMENMECKTIPRWQYNALLASLFLVPP